MKSQFFAAINQICDEKNIPRDKVIETIEAALRAAYRKDYGNKNQEIDVSLDNESGLATVYLVKNIVDKVEDEDLEMSLKEANKYDKKAKVGGVVKIDVTPTDYGRIAAQAAKQVIIQKIQDAERDVLYDVFKDRENELINSIVQRVDGRNVYVNLDNKTTTHIPYEHQIPGEKYYNGQRIKLYLDKVVKTTKGPQLIISRTHPNLVKKLLELEIPEIKSGLVEIKAIAREPGVRCKVSVYSSDEKIDPIGSCVGQKGVRVQNIMDELNGERIDIIQWNESIESHIKTALAPAKVAKIVLFEDEKRAKIYVDPDQRPLAIGKQGQNVRLASLLTGWELDILDVGDLVDKDTASKEKAAKATLENISDLDLDPAVIQALEDANLTLVQQIKGLGSKDFLDVDGIDEEAAEEIVAALAKVA
ncbi:transcription termination/antitermination protein NusA [Candidatus Peregrinibacteria bacterium HGW-Peregrinibacteria-1]|jgi:N utilization substance protein A|nr:MAG: transcription termination/antitermination protein NusA [Candidatus Peregrinibacteria bacterium HGW-Peregrinibacteria-1]